MRISVSIKEREAYCVYLGYRSSVYGLTIIKEYYGDANQIEYADWILGCFKHPKYWFKK